MFFALAVILGVLLAVARGLSMTEIGNRRFDHLWILALALGLRLLMMPLINPHSLALTLATVPTPGLPPFGGLLFLTSLMLILVFLTLNRSYPGIDFLLLGLTLNLLVVGANGGQMPGDPSQLERAGLLSAMLEEQSLGLWSTFSIIEEHTRFWFLADIIYMPLPFRAPVILSVGDLAIALGAILFFNVLPRASIGNTDGQGLSEASLAASIRNEGEQANRD